MIKSLSTAATGMEAQETRLNVTANNIANVSTAGFKKSRAEFQDLMYQTIKSAGAPSSASTKSPNGLQVGAGTRVVATQKMMTEGELRQTGNALDVAIEGRGFYAVTMPGGDTAYTRDGSFKIDNEGRMVTNDGYPLASDITIPPDAQNVTIGADGTVSVTVQGEAAAVEVGKIEVTMFANPAGLSSEGRNFFRETAASGTPTATAPGSDGAGTLSQGTLELSNVQVVEEMVDLIAGQRAYEINSRVIKAADEMLAQTAMLK